MQTWQFLYFLFNKYIKFKNWTFWNQTFWNLTFCKPDVLQTWRFETGRFETRRFETRRFETWRFVGVPLKMLFSICQKEDNTRSCKINSTKNLYDFLKFVLICSTFTRNEWKINLRKQRFSDHLKMGSQDRFTTSLFLLRNRRPFSIRCRTAYVSATNRIFGHTCSI